MSCKLKENFSIRKKLAYWSGLIGTERRETRKFCENFCDTRELFGISVLVIVQGIFLGKFYNVQVFCTFSRYTVSVENFWNFFWERRVRKEYFFSDK